jgi:hypothetical protein
VFFANCGLYQGSTTQGTCAKGQGSCTSFEYRIRQEKRGLIAYKYILFRENETNHFYYKTKRQINELSIYFDTKIGI